MNNFHLILTFSCKSEAGSETESEAGFRIPVATPFNEAGKSEMTEAKIDKMLVHT